MKSVNYFFCGLFMWIIVVSILFPFKGITSCYQEMPYDTIQDTATRERIRFDDYQAKDFKPLTDYRGGRTLQAIEKIGYPVGFGYFLYNTYGFFFISDFERSHRNFPFLMANQVTGMKMSNGLSFTMKEIGSKNPGFRYDPISFEQAMKAPFQLENIITPITLGMIGLAILPALLSISYEPKGFKDLEKLPLFAWDVNKHVGAGIYTPVMFYLSYNAGVWEEYLFRNVLLPIWAYNHGDVKGLLYSSLLFGALHIYQGVGAVVGTSLIGAALGYDVMRRGYKIGPAIAAHAWYNATLMLSTFLLMPEENFLLIRATFSI